MIKVEEITWRLRVYYVVKIVYINPSSGYDEIYYRSQDGSHTGDILQAEIFADKNKAIKQALIEESGYCEEPDYDNYKITVQEVEIHY